MNCTTTYTVCLTADYNRNIIPGATGDEDQGLGPSH